MRSYLGVTCHFIADFKLQSLMLACRHFMGSHTGDEIATHFEEIVESFDLTGVTGRLDPLNIWTGGPIVRE